MRNDLKAHAAHDADALAGIMKALDAIDKKLEPISDTYTTVGSLGKWTMGLLVAISIVVGIVWGIIQIITSAKIP